MWLPVLACAYTHTHTHTHAILNKGGIKWGFSDTHFLVIISTLPFASYMTLDS